MSEAGGLLLGDAIGDERGLGHPFALAHPLDQVILDTAAGHRAHDLSILTDREQRTGRTGGRAPGLDDGDQPDGASLGMPGAGLSKHQQVETVHARLPQRLK
jgi:hypothetical protein